MLILFFLFFFSCRRALDIERTDVWPKPKTSAVEERFLSLIDPDDYTRVREFNIDEKGTVVSRGDSFRLKSPSSHKRGKIEHCKRIYLFIYNSKPNMIYRNF